MGTSLLDTEQYPAEELIPLYRHRWEIELAFDEIKNHLGLRGAIPKPCGKNCGPCSRSIRPSAGLLTRPQRVTRS
ncbi:transposase [Streptomyces sp. NPDC127190]|uniref:transposase n=1 Tax=unclassified Streptomyces TaxID=2593676 RepID=UPI00362A6082